MNKMYDLSNNTLHVYNGVGLIFNENYINGLKTLIRTTIKGYRLRSYKNE